MDNCLIRVNEALDTFSKQELKVANYVLKHPNEVSIMTVAELSHKCKCSTATIMRFCYALKYDGYRDFIKSLYSEVRNKDQNQEQIYSFNNAKNLDEMSIKSLIYTISKLNFEAINSTSKILNEDDVSKAINLIDKANKVHIYALSGSVVVADDAVFKFQRLGIDAQSYKDQHSQILSASFLNPSDVALVISYTGETDDILNTAKILKKNKIPVIAILKYGDNSLSKLADINLYHSSIGKDLKTYSTRSRVVQNNIIDILFTALSQIRKDQLDKYYKLFAK
ncbi:MAG TPA: hypothetical protein DEA28_01770 [Firmicutes bacterium]|nr:hypothetical protein [Bacillota bacterium]